LPEAQGESGVAPGRAKSGGRSSQICGSEPAGCQTERNEEPLFHPINRQKKRGPSLRSESKARWLVADLPVCRHDGFRHIPESGKKGPDVCTAAQEIRKARNAQIAEQFADSCGRTSLAPRSRHRDRAPFDIGSKSRPSRIEPRDDRRARSAPGCRRWQLVGRRR